MIINLDNFDEMTGNIFCSSIVCGYSLTYNKKVYKLIEQEYQKYEEECFEYYLSEKNSEFLNNIFDIEREEIILKFSAIVKFMCDKVSSDENFSDYYNDFILRIAHKGYSNLIDKIDIKYPLNFDECSDIIYKQKYSNKNKTNLISLVDSEAVLFHIMLLIFISKSKDFTFIEINNDETLPSVVNWVVGVLSATINYDKDKNDSLTDQEIKGIIGEDTFNLLDKSFKITKSDKFEDLIVSIESLELSKLHNSALNNEEEIMESRKKLLNDSRSISKYITNFHMILKISDSSISNITQCKTSKKEFFYNLQFVALKIKKLLEYKDYSENDFNEIIARFIANLIISMAYGKTYNIARNIYLFNSKKNEMEKYLLLKNNLEKQNLDNIKKLQKSERKAASLEENFKKLQEKNKKLELENKRLSMKIRDSFNYKEELNSLRNYMFSTSKSNEKEPVDKAISDFSKIKNKKMVLFGGHSSLHSKLKEILTNTTFVEVNAVNFDLNIMKNADKIIIYTDHISHSLYYKISEGISKYNCSVKFISKIRNINLILSEIAEDF